MNNMNNNELMVIESILTEINELNTDKNCNSFRFDEAIKFAKRILLIYNMTINYNYKTCFTIKYLGLSDPLFKFIAY